MAKNQQFDAVVVGSGPNGLAAAITLQRKGLKVLIREGHSTIGGGLRTEELISPGNFHDICSAIHPLAVGSPFFADLPLSEYGLEFIYPEAALAHPFPDGRAVCLYKDIEKTAKQFGEDADTYRQIMEPLVNNWSKIAPTVLGPLSIPSPSNLLALVTFGWHAIWPATTLSKHLFKTEEARGFFTGLAAHSMLPLNQPFTAAIGLVLAILAHTVGWPVPKGGSAAIAKALSDYFKALGGIIETGHWVKCEDDIPEAKIVMLDIGPSQILEIYGHKLPWYYKKQLENYKYSQGVFKVDWLIEGEIPFKNQLCNTAGTVHLGGNMETIDMAEKSVWENKVSEEPYTLLAQQSVFDRSRAIEGHNTIWAYIHCPAYDTTDHYSLIEQQVERYAPGFKEQIVDKRTMHAQAMQLYNPNYVGGDINGGAQNWKQLFTRPVVQVSPYKIPIKGHYICSSSTPPGGGVHGMCGYHAAAAALKDGKF